MASYAGQVLLIVNVASRCGFTPQYKGLQDLHARYRPQGLVVLGFPCDQFGHQEPGSDAEILTFCETRFAISFPLFSKIEVNGKDAHPLYVFLKQQKRGLLGSRIKWNFTKFLVSRQGTVTARFAPSTTPNKIAPRIEFELAR
jgi:glutathione peroxidase